MKHFSENQLKIAVKILDQEINETGYKDASQRTQLLKLKHFSLQRIEELRTQAANSSLAEIKEAVKEVQDPEAKSALLERVSEFENFAKDRSIVREAIIDVALERQRSKIKLDAEERRTKTRARFWGQFLARESVATLAGSILLVIITIALLVAMFIRTIEPKIIENGFLVLLPYFFGQTISRARLPEGKKEEENRF